MSTAKDKMELIQATFQDAKEKVSDISNLEQLNESLLKFPNEFISVAYEGASMGLAIKTIQETNSLAIWDDFYQHFGLKHSTQIYIGLGWAFSELNLDFSDVDIIITPSLQYRVMDGYGYYEGIFKRKSSIRMQQVPQFDALSLRSYDQGLGRSLWYIAQGEVERLARTIHLFPENRQDDLWRGIGIASSYVGGIDTIILEQLTKEAGKYLPSFKCGAAMLIQSRTKANTIVDDTEVIANFLFGVSCDSINKQLTELEVAANGDYFNWLSAIIRSIGS